MDATVLRFPYHTCETILLFHQNITAAKIQKRVFVSPTNYAQESRKKPKRYQFGRCIVVIALIMVIGHEIKPWIFRQFLGCSKRYSLVLLQKFGAGLLSLYNRARANHASGLIS